MDRVDKYKRIEDDQQQGKGKAKVIPQEMRDFRSNRYNNNRSKRDYVGQSGSTNTQMVNAVFWEPVQQVLEKIKNNHSSNGQTKWLETLQSATKAFTAITIKNRDTLQKIVENCGIIWTSLSKKEN